MDVRELVGRLGLDVDDAAFALGHALLDGLRDGLKGIAGVAGAVGIGIAGAVGLMTREGGKLDELSKQLDVSAVALQTLGFAASQNGVSVEEMSSALGILSRNASEALQGSKGQAEAFARAGVSLRNASGDAKSAEELFRELSDRFKEMPDGVTKAGLSMELFGRSGRGLLPTLNLGAQGIAELERRAVLLGGVMDQETVDAADKLGDTVDELMMAFKGFRNMIGGPLLNDIAEVVKGVVDWYVANRELIRSKVTAFIWGLTTAAKALWKYGLSPVVTTLGFVIRHWRLFAVLAGSTLLALGALKLALIAQSTSLLFAAAGYVGLGVAAVWAGIKAAAAWVAATWPVIALAAAIAAVILIVEDLYTWLTGGESFIGGLGEAWTRFLDEFLAPSGDDPWWLATIKDFFRLIFDFGGEFPKLIGAWGDLFSEFFGAIANGAAKLWSAIKSGDIGGALSAVGSTMKSLSATGLGGATSAAGQAVLGAAWNNLNTPLAAGAASNMNNPNLYSPFGDGASLTSSVAASSNGSRPIVLQPRIDAKIGITAAPGQSPGEVAGEARNQFSEMLATETRGLVEANK